jgi:hypothetical protein
MCPAGADGGGDVGQGLPLGTGQALASWTGVGGDAVVAELGTETAGDAGVTAGGRASAEVRGRSAVSLGARLGSGAG